jgi:hypothetical protein
MRLAIESRPFATDSGELHITASFGTAASSSATPINSKTLLQIAHEARRTPTPKPGFYFYSKKKWSVIQEDTPLSLCCIAQYLIVKRPEAIVS